MLLQVRSDILFHDLYNQEDMQTIEWVVMQILDCSYEEIHGKVSVENVRLTRTLKKDRTRYLDLIVEYQGDKIIIELNNNFKGIYTRNILYAANVLLNNYAINDDKHLDSDYYRKVVRVLLVNLNWYPKESNIVGKKEYSIPYSDLEEKGYLLKIINVNLDYYSKICYDEIMKGDKFYKLLTVKNRKELESFTSQNKMLERYSKKLIDLSSDDRYLEDVMDDIIEENVAKQTAYLIGKDDGIEEGIERGLQEGIEKGISKKQNEIIKKMYEDNIALEDIMKYTDLTLLEVKKIIHEFEQ